MEYKVGDTVYMKGLYSELFKGTITYINPENKNEVRVKVDVIEYKTYSTRLAKEKKNGRNIIRN